MSDIKWAKSVMEKVDQGKEVPQEDLQRASEILMREVESVLPKTAKNQTELANIFKVDRKTIQRWRKEPGFPKPRANGSWDVRATQAWVRANNKVDNTDEEDLHDLKIRQLKLICEKLEHELAVKREEYTENALVERWVASMIQEAKTILLAIPPKLAPVMAGLEPVEVEDRLKEAIDEALAQLHLG
tara:strand:- start:3724 stop:4284 length:561 start_codon:yes stop_codon:yes gene_type:complete